MRQTSNHISLESFRERASGKKVILLYPWTNYRNLFLSHFLTSAQDGLLYYRIPKEMPSLEQWVADLVAELDDVIGGFGQHTRALMKGDDPVPAAMLGAALAADLNAYQGTQTVLFIDDLDRVKQDQDFRAFMRALVADIADGVQLAVSSRLLTYEPWRDFVAAGQAVILGTEHRRADLTFTIEEHPKPQLEVYSLGRGYVLVNGKPIDNWDGALPRNLFFYFIDYPLVTRDEIFQTFWPELSVKEATNVFHVTKRKITERIAARLDGEAYELTHYASGFYLPSDKIVRHYDVIDFLSAVDDAMVAQNDRQEEMLYTRAIDLYKAPFLHGITMSWAVNRRDQLRQSYAQALIGMGRLSQRRELPEHALGYFTRALKETPEREDIHREVMRLYARMGMVEDSVQHYRRLEQYLLESVGVAPALETRQMFESISGQVK